MAAGDAHKANLLVTDRLKSINCESPTDESIELSHLKMKSVTLLAEALGWMWEHVGLHEVCREGLALFPSHPELKRYSEAAAKILEKKRNMMRNGVSGALDREWQKHWIAQGLVFYEQYPFMSTDHMSRDRNAIDTVKRTFQAVSSNCSLAPRTFSDSSLSQAEGFGIYAIADIKPSTRLFDDETILGATDRDTSNSSATKRPEICENCCGYLPAYSTSRVKSTCCSTVYCSEHCRGLASTFYHSEICGRDFKWLFEGLQGTSEYDPAIDGPMFLRVLSICTQSNCHPLEHPLIARLVPKLSDESPRNWTFRDRIVNPNKILQQLGVDIFQDLRFDTWVLQNVRSRLKTNQHGHRTSSGRYVLGVNSLHSFINHSCEPNARGSIAQTSEGATAHDSTAMSVVSTKPIKAGEEICIDYNFVSGIKQKSKRHEMLLNWIPRGACACTLCQREE